jgi:hypothetical protein
LLLGDAADISRGMFDGAEKITREIAARGTKFRAADPERAARQAKSIETARPAKQCRIAIPANIGENARRHALGSRVVRTAPGEKSSGNCIGEFEDTHQRHITS